MSYSFYDWNNALQQRNEYVEDRLKDGSPVVAVSFEGGILMLTLRGSQQRKVYEVYDRLMMGALGKQSDVESLRLAAIDSAHREGFERSPDDVSIQRLVGFGLSPAVKRVYNDQQTIPLTLRAVFAELGRTPDTDHLFVLGYDGEFKTRTGAAVAAGTSYAEEQAEESLKDATPTTLTEALKTALTAWGVGRARLAPEPEKRDEDEDFDPLAERGTESEGPRMTTDPTVAVREAIKDGASVEAALLQRNTSRETKFRLLRDTELEEALAEYR
jgi:proteasome alpha subunit